MNRTKARFRLQHIAFVVASLFLFASASAQTVHPNASSVSLSTSPAGVMSCPAGDGGTMRPLGTVINVEVIATTGTAISWLTHNYFEVDGMVPGAVADGFSPGLPPGFDVASGGFVNQGNGLYTIEGPFFAGGYGHGPASREDIGPAIVKAGGVLIANGSPLALTMVSPDLSADGVVNLVDVGIFADILMEGQYDWRIDFNFDGFLNLSDIGIFAFHYGHHLPGTMVIDSVD